MASLFGRPAGRRVPGRGDYFVELTAAGDYALVFNTFDVHRWGEPTFVALRYYMRQVFPGVADAVIRAAFAALHVSFTSADPVPAGDDEDYQVHVLAGLHRAVVAWMAAHHPGLRAHAPKLRGDGLRHADRGGAAKGPGRASVAVVTANAEPGAGRVKTGNAAGAADREMARAADRETAGAADRDTAGAAKHETAGAANRETAGAAGHETGVANRETAGAAGSGAVGSHPADPVSAEVGEARALYERLCAAFPEAIELRGRTAWPAFLRFVAEHAAELRMAFHGKGASAPSIDDLRKVLAQVRQHVEAKAGERDGEIAGHDDGKRGGVDGGGKDGDVREAHAGGDKDGSIYGAPDGSRSGWVRWVPQGRVRVLPDQPTHVAGAALNVELAWDLSVHPDAGLILLPQHCDYVWRLRRDGKQIDSTGHSIFANDRHTSLELGDEPGAYEVEVVATSRHFKTAHHRFATSVVVHAVEEQAFDLAAFDQAHVRGPDAAFDRDDRGELHLKAGEAAQTTEQELASLDVTRGSVDALATQGKLASADHDLVVRKLARQRAALVAIQHQVRDGAPYVVRGTFVSREDSSTLPLRLLLHVRRRAELGGVAHYDVILHDTTFGEPTQHPGAARQALGHESAPAVYRRLEGEALGELAAHFHAHNDYPKGTVHLAAQCLASERVWETTIDTNNGRKRAKKVLGTVAAIGGAALLVVPGGNVVSAGLMVATSTAGIASVALELADRVAKEGHLKLDRRLVLDVLQVVAIALPFGTLTRTFGAASTVAKGRFLLCMASLDAAQGFLIARDVQAQLRLIDASTAVQLAEATGDDQRAQIHAERDRQVAEVIGGAMVNGGFLLVSLGHGIKNVAAATRAGASFRVREPVRDLAQHGRDRIADVLASGTFDHEAGRVELTAEERRYLEHELAAPAPTGEPATQPTGGPATEPTGERATQPTSTPAPAKHAGATERAAEHATADRAHDTAHATGAAEPAAQPADEHPGIELHNHLLGIPATKYFVARVGAGEPRALFEKIDLLFQRGRHAADLHAEAPATRQVVDATRAALAELDRTGASKLQTDVYLLGQLDKILAASDETPFDQSYSIRDVLIKEYIDPTPPGQKQGYKNFTADALQTLSEDGIKYSEQSVSAKKLTENLTPADLAAAHQTAAAAGKDSDLRFLAMMNTKTIAAEAPVEPGAGAPKAVLDAYATQKAAYDRILAQYGKTLEMIDRVLARGDVMGIDIAGPEDGRFTAEGVQRFLEMYDHISAAAKARGRELVLRPHVGEGYSGPGAEDVAHVEVARANLQTLLEGLAKVGYTAAKGKADGVIVRFGHATHATPEQIVRMKTMGIIAEANIGSNLATGSIASLDGHPLLYNLYFDVPTILSTDGHGVMNTSMASEYERAAEIIQRFKLGLSTIEVGGVIKRYEHRSDPANTNHDPRYLAPEQKARFTVDKLKAWAREYGDRVRAGDRLDADRQHTAPSTTEPGQTKP